MAYAITEWSLEASTIISETCKCVINYRGNSLPYARNAIKISQNEKQLQIGCQVVHFPQGVVQIFFFVFLIRDLCHFMLIQLPSASDM
jgi:hypothetical protein